MRRWRCVDSTGMIDCNSDRSSNGCGSNCGDDCGNADDRKSEDAPGDRASGKATERSKSTAQLTSWLRVASHRDIPKIADGWSFCRSFTLPRRRPSRRPTVSPVNAARPVTIASLASSNIMQLIRN